MECTAGIDLASAEHRLLVVDGEGRQLEQRRISDSEAGLQALLRRLLELEVARVALERPNGLVVDRLLEAGIAVVPVHPNQLDPSQLDPSQLRPGQLHPRRLNRRRLRPGVAAATL